MRRHKLNIFDHSSSSLLWDLQKAQHRGRPKEEQNIKETFHTPNLSGPFELAVLFRLRLGKSNLLRRDPDDFAVAQGTYGIPRSFMRENRRLSGTTKNSGHGRFV